MNFRQLDKLVDDLDKCGDLYCGSIITSNQIKEEDLKFLKMVNQSCNSKTLPQTEEQYKFQRKKYDECFTQMKSKSNYYKRLTQRKKCEDKKCKKIQDKIKKTLSKPKPIAKKSVKSKTTINHFPR